MLDLKFFLNGLFKAVQYVSAIKFHNQIYASAADESGSYPIQRLDLAEDGTIEQIELIGNHNSAEPVLYIVDANTCTNN